MKKLSMIMKKLSLILVILLLMFSGVIIVASDQLLINSEINTADEEVVQQEEEWLGHEETEINTETDEEVDFDDQESEEVDDTPEMETDELEPDDIEADDIGADEEAEIELDIFNLEPNVDATVGTTVDFEMALNAAPTDGTQWVINITDDLLITGMPSVFNERAIGSNRNIVLQSENDIDIMKTSNHRHFTVSGNATLTIGSGVTLRRIPTNTVDGGGVEVNNTGTFVLNGGTIAYNRNLVGGGVAITSGGTLYMHAGAIRNNHGEYGGGVHVASGGTFNMSGASTIDRNEARTTHIQSTPTTTTTGGGGGIHVSGGTFNMSGGQISRNISRPSGGIGGGGGVHLTNGAEFNMSAGVIGGDSLAYANTFGNAPEVGFNAVNGLGAGVFIEGSVLHLSGTAQITFNDTSNTNGGGGIYMGGATSQITMNDNVLIANNGAGNWGGGIQMVSGTVIMNRGVIEHNRVNAAGTGGGGVNINGGNFIMNGGTIRHHRENRQGTIALIQNGSGVRMQAGNFTMSGDARIENNEANRDGGGVFMTGGTFNMLDGSIQNNITGSNISAPANAMGRGGGGVHMTGGTFNMVDGTIADNTSHEHGGGFLVGNNATLNVNYGSITGNTASRDGGGIFTDRYRYEYLLIATDYNNLTIDSATIFANNTADEWFEGPRNPEVIEGHIPVDIQSSIVGVHVLNNDDINWRLTAVPFEFTKMDELLHTNFSASEPLSGATFRLYVRNDEAGCLPVTDDVVTPAGVTRGCWVLLGTQTSDTNGHVMFDNLIPGRLHHLIETEAPTGFLVPDGHWVIDNVAVEGTLQITASGAPDFLTRYGYHYVSNLREHIDIPITGIGIDGGIPLTLWLPMTALVLLGLWMKVRGVTRRYE